MLLGVKGGLITGGAVSFAGFAKAFVQSNKPANIQGVFVSCQAVFSMSFTLLLAL
jgi:hypothetical protein